MMVLLCLDTSAITSVALLDNGELIAEGCNVDPRSHAESVTPLIGELLSPRPEVQLTALVVGVGPGPFTGLRAGIITARALSATWAVPLHGVMSLDALAYDALTAEAAPTGQFVVVSDARRQEVYWARYDAHGRRLDGPHVGPPQAVPPLPAYGAGAGLYADVFAGQLVAEYRDRHPSAGAVGRLAHWQRQRGEPLLSSAPLYVRSADAKVPGARKRALPLAGGAGER